jgi:hypothetical protein
LRAISTNAANVALRKKKRQTKADLWRSYGLTRPSKPRYAGRKGIYWHLLSIKVRRRDFEAFNGECIDQCGGRAQTWRDFQAGHFVAAGHCGFGLLFDEQNVNGQLAVCNNPTFTPDAGYGYGIGLDKRYGPGTAARLMARRQEGVKEWGQPEYDARIRALIDDLGHAA